MRHVKEQAVWLWLQDWVRSGAPDGAGPGGVLAGAVPAPAAASLPAGTRAAANDLMLDWVRPRRAASLNRHFSACECLGEEGLVLRRATNGMRHPRAQRS